MLRPHPLLLLLLLLPLSLQIGDIVIELQTPTLNAQSNYYMKGYSVQDMPESGYFRVDLTQTHIVVPDGPIPTEGQIDGIAVPGATGDCANMVCTLKMNSVIPRGKSQIVFGPLTNPYLLVNQDITVFSYYNQSYN